MERIYDDGFSRWIRGLQDETFQDKKNVDSEWKLCRNIDGQYGDSDQNKENNGAEREKKT